MWFGFLSVLTVCSYGDDTLLVQVQLEDDVSVYVRRRRHHLISRGFDSATTIDEILDILLDKGSDVKLEKPLVNKSDVKLEKARDACATPVHWLKASEGKEEQCLGEKGKLSDNTNLPRLLSAVTHAVPHGRAILWFGTFLGWYRNCGVLGSDHDIDLAVFPEDLSNTNWPQLKDAVGYGGHLPQYQLADKVVAKQWINTTDGEIDIWVMHSNSSHYIVLHPYWKRTYVIPKKFNDHELSFQHAQIDNVSIFAPYPAKVWAEAMFGQSWETPMLHEEFNKKDGPREHLDTVVTHFETEAIATAKCF
jgi:hypothetical protein